MGCLRNGDISARGLKRNGIVTFHFHIVPLSFRTACKMVLGLLNWLADSLGFRTACETVLGLLNFSHALQKISRVFKMISHGWFIFAQHAKLISMVCEIFAPHAKRFINFAGCANCLGFSSV